MTYSKESIELLRSKYYFNLRELEKVLRISDLLEDIFSVKFLKERLSLYGGTALNFIHFDIPRLSVDLDFNYRHVDRRDWGKVREDVEGRIKEILYLRNYKDESIKINPSYPLCRFDVSYNNCVGLEDSFKIEIGYMRRYPILKKDDEADFFHIGGGESFKVKTPVEGELFANKFCTCLSRATPRDVYDVHRISKQNFNREIFRKCAVIESLMLRIRLDKIDLTRINSISLDTGLENLLRTGERPNFSEIKSSVIEFAAEVKNSLTNKEVDLIERFINRKEFSPELIDGKIFHPQLNENPAIIWVLRSGFNSTSTES
ncbi:MAG: nucleotidyl transferase AbiEii/AbiGii toxin family protein [Candidatus Lokiarchaeia archaeon]